jgi:excisionase family DNA binding protein
MSFALAHTEPVLPSELEIQLAQASSRTLAKLQNKDKNLQLRVSDENTEITLPAYAVRLLIDILTNLSEGSAVTIIPIHAELTTQQAADLLNVSRKFFIDELLEKQQIPFRKVGSHRRILFQHLMEYKQANEAKRLEAIDQLVELDQSLGLYE